MKTVVEYDRKKNKKKRNRFNREHTDGRMNTLHYKQIQYEFCSKKQNKNTAFRLKFLPGK